MSGPLDKRSPALPDDVLALLAETAALAQAGMPLETSLVQVASELPPRMQALAAELSQRLSQGEALEAVLADPRLRLPPAYAAVVTAGVRSGRLGEALQKTAETSRQLREVSGALRLGMFYPLLVALTAYVAWLVVVSLAMPKLDAMFLDSHLRPHPLLVWLRPLFGTWPWWGPVAPLALLAAVAAWRWWAARTWTPSEQDARPRPTRLPRLRHVAWSCQQARFADLLALLVGQHVPLHQALRLATESCGNARVAADGQVISERLERGAALADAWPVDAPLSPVARCLLAAGGPPRQLADKLAQAAAVERRTARLYAERVKVFWPVAWTVLVGGTAVLLAALSLFVPVTRLYRDLSLP